MPKQSKIVTVFGSAHWLEGDADYEEARVLGRELARRGFAVCSGGYGGVMEAVSRGAKEGGGRTMAVTSKVFQRKANEWVDEEHLTATWEERLFELVRRGDGFVACKGGTGTLVELAVVWEMLNKRILRDKPFAVLGDFWVPVLERVRELELGRGHRTSEAGARQVAHARTPMEVADMMATALGRGSR